MARKISLSFEPGTRGRMRAPELRRIVRGVLDAEEVAPAVEVEVILAGPETSRRLNRLYRGRDEPTDVLSFAASEGEGFLSAPDEAPSLGEIVVCVELAEAQGLPRGQADASRDAEAAIAHLLVHGLLHLMGHDHELGDAEAKRMQEREDELLDALGYTGRYQHGH